MNSVIWKFDFEANSIKGSHHTATLSVPKGAKLVHIGMQGLKVCAWMEVDPNETEKEDLNIHSIGTGHGVIPPGVRHHTSINHGSYVWHLYVDQPPDCEVLEEILATPAKDLVKKGKSKKTKDETPDDKGEGV